MVQLLTDSIQQAPPLVYPGNPEHCPTKNKGQDCVTFKNHTYLFIPKLQVALHIADAKRRIS